MPSASFEDIPLTGATPLLVDNPPAQESPPVESNRPGPDSPTVKDNTPASKAARRAAAIVPFPPRLGFLQQHRWRFMTLTRNACQFWSSATFTISAVDLMLLAYHAPLWLKFCFYTLAVLLVALQCFLLSRGITRGFVSLISRWSRRFPLSFVVGGFPSHCRASPRHSSHLD